MFVSAAVMLALAAVWVLLGSFLWGSNATQLTSLVMPAIVAGLKLKADKAVTKVKDAAPTLSSAAQRGLSGAQALRKLAGAEGGLTGLAASEAAVTGITKEGTRLLRRIRAHAGIDDDDGLSV